MARIKQSRRTIFLRCPVPFSGLDASTKKTKLQIISSAGQATVEYVLLLTVAVGIAAIITKSLVSRDPENADRGARPR